MDMHSFLVTHASWVLGDGSPDISQSTRDIESIQRRSASGAEFEYSSPSLDEGILGQVW
jgi:hypothetical protein